MTKKRDSNTGRRKRLVSTAAVFGICMLACRAPSAHASYPSDNQPHTRHLRAMAATGAQSEQAHAWTSHASTASTKLESAVKMLHYGVAERPGTQFAAAMEARGGPSLTSFTTASTAASSTKKATKRQQP